MRASYWFKFFLATIIIATNLFCWKALHAQQAFSLSGMIEDETHKPLIGASVSINPKTGTVSDINGKFTIPHSYNDSVDLYITYLGYENHKQRVAPYAQNILITLKPSGSQLNQIVVSAGKYNQEIKRVTVSTDIIKPYLIENKVTVNMENIMNQLPGVNVVDGQANIRGGSGWSYGAGSRVLVMLDDMPYITGDANQVQWKFLPTENIEQLEVIKGASSVLYGSSALNGVINIRTAKPKDKPQLQFTSFAGIYDKLKRDSSRWSNTNRMQYGFNFFESQRIKRLDLTVALNGLKDEGYRMGERDERIRFSVNTNYRHGKIAGLQYGLNASIMSTKAQSFLLWESWQQAYTSLDSQTTNSKTTIFSIDPHADFFVWGLKHRIRSRILRNINDIETMDPSVNQDNASWMVYGEYQLQKELPRQLGVITGGFAMSNVSSNSPLYNGVHTSHNTAPYIQADIRFRRWSFSAGSRHEIFNMDGKSESKTIFRAGSSFEATKSTFLRASYGQGYRFPSIAERYISTSAGAINVFPNPQLRSETGWNAEVGIKQGFKISNWQGFADVAYFHTEYQNMVEFNFGQWKALDFNNPSAFLKSFGFTSLNIGDARITGIDAALTGSGAIGAIGIRSLVGYTYINPVSLTPDRVFVTDSSANLPGADPKQGQYTYRNTGSDTSTNTLKYRYNHLFKADIEATYKKWSIGYSIRYNSYYKNSDRVFETPPISIAVPGIADGRAVNKDGDWLMDVRVSCQLTTIFKLNAVVNNLTNHEQMTRPADMRPPRLFMLQLTVKF